MITLCETCHKAYHRGEFELKIKRGVSLRDAAAMSIMRWEVFNRARAEFSDVNLTYGYKTKHTRIHNNIEKTHCADAFCIAGNVHAKRLSWHYRVRMLQRHTRSLHAFKPAKGEFAKVLLGRIGLVSQDFKSMTMWNGAEKRRLFLAAQILAIYI